MRFLLRLVVNAVAVFLAATLVPGIHVSCPGPAVATVFAATVVAHAATDPDPAVSRFPPRLTVYFDKYVRLDAAASNRLLAGQPVTKLLESDPSKEVGVLGAVWIDAPVSRYLSAVQDIERFESGSAFRVTKKIGSPPRLEDFAALQLPDDDIKDLRTCQVSDCQLKLSAAGIERVRSSIQWNGPDTRQQ